MCMSCKNNCINRKQIMKGKSCILHIYSFYALYISFCRTTRKEKIEREKKEAKKERAQQIPSGTTMPAATHGLPTPTLPSPVTPRQATPLSSPQVTPQNTPQAVGCFAIQPSSFKTPCTSKHRPYAAPASPASTVDSLDSFIDPEQDPEQDRTPVIHKRGRPQKVPQSPSCDDRSVNASTEEMKKWQKHKNSKKWWYEKLASSEASEYREKEKERASRYVRE